MKFLHVLSPPGCSAKKIDPTFLPKVGFFGFREVS
jgi:hypothetical protein